MIIYYTCKLGCKYLRYNAPWPVLIKKHRPYLFNACTGFKYTMTEQESSVIISLKDEQFWTLCIRATASLLRPCPFEVVFSSSRAKCQPDNSSCLAPRGVMQIKGGLVTLGRVACVVIAKMIVARHQRRRPACSKGPLCLQSSALLSTSQIKSAFLGYMQLSLLLIA